MKASILIVLTLCILFAATAGKADNGSTMARMNSRTADSGVIERWSDRALARMQGWISHARNKLTGGESNTMQGCGDMMAGMQMMQGGGMNMMQGGGMMGGMRSSQPNDQWRSQKPADR